MRMSEKEFQNFAAQHPGLFSKQEIKKRGNKYQNVKLYEYADGFVTPDKSCENHGKKIATFDSIKEYQRWHDLRLLLKSGNISNLERQKTFLIQEAFNYNGKKISAINYKADFSYTDKTGQIIVEDVKPFDDNLGRYRLTKDFVLKWKLLMHKYPDIIFQIY